ncbi:MAG: DsrE family protein [Thaumarchaeota archaeon]|nr:DsrE family protein [Nitrososphaerota archaeon]
MKIGIVLNTSDPETAWNTLRFGVTSLMNEHEVRLFLLGRGVEIEEVNNGSFDVAKQMQRYLKAGGKILACGTCLKVRKKSEMKICPVSSMQELLEIVERSDKVLTFS